MDAGESCFSSLELQEADTSYAATHITFAPLAGNEKTIALPKQHSVNVWITAKWCQAKQRPQSGQVGLVVEKLHPQAGQVACSARVLNTAPALLVS